LQGFAPKFARGEIASLSGAVDDARYFQISVPVQPGNSGGALVDEHGNVVGIVSAKLDASAVLAASGALPENVNYAVKSREGRHVAVPNFRDADTASLPSSNPCRRFRPG
jgi:S1-C subfamily serine protease